MIYFYCIVSNDQTHLSDPLRKSLLKFGHHLQVLPIYDFNLKNLSKIYKLNKYLESNEYEDDDIIVLSDAFDVVCVNNPDKLISYFETKKIDVLISTENMFGPNFPVIKEFYDNYTSTKGTSNRYPNSGVIIGKAKPLQKFYKNLTDSMPKLAKFFPSYATNKTSDQAHIIDYLYEINFVDYKEIKIELDLFDDITFTNTINEREFNIEDFVFIHTWGIYLKQPEYKHIKDKQFLKWTNINKYLKLDEIPDKKSVYTFCLVKNDDLCELSFTVNKILPKIRSDFEIFMKINNSIMKTTKLNTNYYFTRAPNNVEIIYKNNLDLNSALTVYNHYKIWKRIFTSSKYQSYKYFYIVDNDIITNRSFETIEKQIDFDIVLLDSSDFKVEINNIEDNSSIKSLSPSYIISRSGIEKMIEIVGGNITHTLDEYLRNSTLNVFGFV